MVSTKKLWKSKATKRFELSVSLSSFQHLFPTQHNLDLHACYAMFVALQVATLCKKNRGGNYSCVHFAEATIGSDYLLHCERCVSVKLVNLPPEKTHFCYSNCFLANNVL